MLKKFLIPLMLFMNQSSFSAPAGVQVAPPEETLIKNLKVTATNGGINPDFGAYEVSADLYVAPNACVALLYRVSLKEEVRESGPVLVGERQFYTEKGYPQCIPELWPDKPVYRRVNYRISGLDSYLNQVMILNVNEMGAEGLSLSEAALLSLGFKNYLPTDITMYRDGGTIKMEGKLNELTIANVRYDGRIGSSTKGQIFVTIKTSNGTTDGERIMNIRELSELDLALEEYTNNNSDSDPVYSILRRHIKNALN